MNTFYFLYVKRILDITLALLGLILLSPVLMAIALKLKASGPVFFKQTRIGRHFRPFTLYKFRSMNTKPSYKAPPFTTNSDSRITPFGRILRAYKLDELPQLINVLKGDLSFVGPRPLVQGLNGGGWHIHANGGKLNPHLDYSMYPKLPYQRKLNIIVYLQPNWEESWGGGI